ncbi:mucin-2-like [Hoplias malabaricus]|uniref:mucin-2-like n=1 Tax=Hoplias malabaricus TaxID=27720 RepID=UPI003462BC17
MEWRKLSCCVLVLGLTWGLQVNAMRVHRSNHVDNICSMWGNFHFQTFDGDIYQFQGICEYNLVSECNGPVQSFSVHVKRAHVTGNSQITRVLVTIGDMAIEVTRNLVMINSDIVKLPHYVAGVLVEKNAIYTKLYAKLGLSVTWNRDDAIMVELDTKYANHTCGLCGDFNGIPLYDEFLSDARVIGPIEFGNKHRVHNPNDTCEDLYEEVEVNQTTVEKCQTFRAGCAELLEDTAWDSCTRRLNPEPYIQACIVDRCWTRSGDTENTVPLCTTLSEYSRQCSHAGGTPPNWRKPNFCAVKCPFNMEFSESGSPCLDTCTHTDTSSMCEEHKMDGCFCPSGTVFDDISERGCIPQEQCQCQHKQVYNPGDLLRMDDKQCVCQHGKWACENLPTPGLCAVEEGSHFTTFDGREFTFHGDCYYVLSKDCVGSRFIVLGELIPCIGQEKDTCLKSIALLLNNDRNNVLIIKDDGMVRYNGELKLPYSTAELTVFKPSSFHIMLQTSFGLQMQVQLVPLMQLYVSLDQSFQTQTCGLCGNFNKVLGDEMKTPQGLVEGTAASFGNSWKVQYTCPDRTERLDDPCSYNIDSERYAEHWCSKLMEKEGPFVKCHSAVNPESYYKRCKYASCTCEKSESCLCAVFSSYVRACTVKGIFLQGWRDTVCEKYTEHCPASQTYSYLLQGCQRTCDSLSSERQGCSTDYVPVDGCACSDGLYENEKGICVAMDKCSCYHNGVYVKPGKSINIKNEHCVCTNGKLQCQSWKPFTIDCPTPKVFFNCSEAGPDEHGLECAQTCVHKTIDCFAEGCASGCQCPSGLLDDGRGHCVKEHDCPCKHNGHFYAAGSEIPADCNTCICKQGQWDCTDKKCPGICTIYGSGHYNTFDKRAYGFSGDCGYIAVQNKCGNKTGTFSVITENLPCGTTGTTCSKSIRILLGQTQLELIDGSITYTHLVTGPMIKYKVSYVGLYLIIDLSDIGLTVFWDRKTTVRVILQPQHMGDVCGLCGNYNGNGDDDFTTQGQLQVTDILEFVNSWKVNSFFPDVQLDFNPCSKTPTRYTWAKHQCRILQITSETFKDCHQKVDPSPYFDNCVRDSCACDTGGDCECFCTAVAAYAQACNEAGVCVAWRTPEICPVFCEYYNGPSDCLWHYNPCRKPCYKTCLNPEGVCTDPLPNLEGCYPVCPKDKPIFNERNQTCVEICDECRVEDNLYPPGQEITTEKPCTQCFCDENGSGNVTCTPKPGCCFFNGTEYGDDDVIYDVSDNMGMCYKAICINNTIIENKVPCTTTASPPPNTTTTTPPTPSTTTTTPPTPSTTTTTPPTPSTTTTTSPTPSTTTTTPPTPSINTTTPPKLCDCEWTEWFNVYNPSTGGYNDTETYKNIKNAGKIICEVPEDIICREADNPDIPFNEFIQTTGQVVECNASFGLVCEKKNQVRPYKCFDYEISVFCCWSCTTTPPTPNTTTTTPPTPSIITTTPPTPSTITTPPTPSTTTTTPPTPSTTTTPPTPTTTTTTPPTPSTTTTTPPTPSTTTTPPTPSTTTTTPPTPSTNTTTPPTPSTTTKTPPTQSTTTKTPPTPSTTTTTPNTPSTPPTTPPTPSTTTTTPPTPSTTTTTPPTPSTTTATPPTQSTTTTTHPTPSTTTTTPNTPSTTPTTPPTPSTTTTTPPTPSTTTTTPPTPSTTTIPPTPSTTTIPPTPSTTTTTPPTPSTITTSPPTPSTITTTPPTPSTTTTIPPTPSSTTTTHPTPNTTTTLPTPSTITTTPPTPSTTTTTPTTPSTTPTTSPTPSTTTTTSPTPSTTECFCIINGNKYEPGQIIYDMLDIGSGICLTMNCSNICEISNTTSLCPTTTPSRTSTSPSPTPPYDCPEWDINKNEIFQLSNCTMARCIEDNMIEVIPYKCPPVQNITCLNGKMPVLVLDENYCCKHYACDCFCEGWGDPHYITFDGRFYSHQGNCTYVLMEEIRPKHHLKIYIDNVKCDLREYVSCPRALIVSYNNMVITLKNNNLIGAVKLEALIGHEVLKRLPFAENGVRVLGSGVNMILEIPQLEVVVTFGVTGFSVFLPFQHFGNNTHGHCGTCNNNKADDCRLPDGKLIHDCEIMADYWPAKDLYNPNCSVPATVPPTLAPTKKPCPLNPVCELLNSNVFKECHPFISPDNYFKGCQFDSCHMTNPAVVCTSLQTYASACSQLGICIHWRNYSSLCIVECQRDKVYKPCGPAEPPSCEDRLDEQTLNVTTEGCFCPDGQLLFNKESRLCVDKCGCLDPSGQPRELGEEFQYGCQDCICDASTVSVICKPKQCSINNQVTCTEPGFIVVNETDPTDECCTILTCRCDSNFCPSTNGTCNIGYAPVLKVPDGKCCPELSCEPKKVCVHRNMEYEPGTSVPVVDCQDCQCTWDIDPKTQLHQIQCLVVTCDEDCEFGYDYVEPVGDECCGKCVKTKCLLNLNGTKHVLQSGEEWSPKKEGCDRFICTYFNGEYITTNYKIHCPPFSIDNCQPGTVQLAADGCCQVCVEKEKGCKVETISDFIIHNECQSENMVDLTHCAGDCTSYSKYSELSASSCSCCQAARTSNRTVNMKCLNGDTVPHTYFHVEECSCSQTKCHASN